MAAKKKTTEEGGEPEEASIGNIDGMLKEMERAVEIKKRRDAGRKGAQNKRLEDLQQGIEQTLEGYEEKLDSMETQLGIIQKKQNELEALNGKIEELGISVEEDMGKLERRLKRPLKAAIKLETDVTRTLPDELASIEKSLDDLGSELGLLKKEREPKSTQVFEHRVEFLEGEMDTLLGRLGNRATTNEMKKSLKELTDKQDKIIESVKDLSDHQERIIASLSALAEEKNEMAEALEQLQETAPKAAKRED